MADSDEDDQDGFGDFGDKNEEPKTENSGAGWSTDFAAEGLDGQ